MSAPRIDCHVYAINGPDGVLMVDCGTPWGHERIRRNMAHWGLRPEDVRTILLTHGHVDHASGGYLFKPGGAEVLGHHDVLTLVECQWEATGALSETKDSNRMDGTLGDGDVIRRCGREIRVYSTPGHTRECLSYLITIDGARCLFSGDLIMSNCRPGWYGDPGFNAAEIAASMRKLLQMPFDHLFAGHDVRLDDRGELFRRSLEAYEAGDWDRPGEALKVPVHGRWKAPAER
jgi:glyoxylase-like metal-dependent hydrolase (beta-lactamase superfamily II)